MADKQQRYPHRGDNDKGQVFGGECNTSDCGWGGPTVFFSAHTFGYYCRSCAFGINYWTEPRPQCVAVDHQLTIAEMEELGAEGQKRNGLGKTRLGDLARG